MSFPPQGTDTLTNPVIQGTVNPGTGLTLPAFGGVMAGALGATCYVVANNAKAEVKAHAQALHDAGYPVWVCDGIDDQVEIQAAIDALPAGGGKVVLSEGTYIINAAVPAPYEAIVINKNNVSLVGAGATLRLMPANWLGGAVRMIIARNADNVRISGLTIDQNGGGQIHPYFVSIWGIGFISMTNSTIENNKVFNAVYSQNITLHQSSHCIASNNVTDGSGDGIDVRESSDSIITGNRIRNAVTEGIDVNGGTRNVIVGNILKGSGVGVGFQSVGEIHATGNTVSNNIIAGNTRGIRLYPGASRNIISNNYIEYSRHMGIWLDSAHHNIVSNNYLTLNAVDPATIFPNLEIMGSSSFNLIEGNAMRQGHFPFPASPVAGIRVADTAHSNILRNNDLRGFGEQGPILDPVGGLLHYEAHTDLFMDVLAASTTHIHPAITPDGLAHTNVTSPDVSRNVMIRITNTATTAQTPSGGNIVIEGIDARGNPTSETLVVPATSILPGGTSDIFGSKAFATVSKVTYYSETNTNITVSVGISDKLGLSNVIYAVGDVFKVKRGNADVPVGTVDTANGTVDCATIASGDDFTIYYRSNLNILA